MMLNADLPYKAAQHEHPMPGKLLPQSVSNRSRQRSGISRPTHPNPPRVERRSRAGRTQAGMIGSAGSKSARSSESDGSTSERCFSAGSGAARSSEQAVSTRALITYARRRYGEIRRVFERDEASLRGMFEVR